LIANDAFLIERLKERLEKVRTGEAQFCRASADRVLGFAAPRTADAEPHLLVTKDGGANPDQICAIRRSLGSDTTFVWGPPGTGKTTTLARIVEAHYRNGRSVLLVSNTNIAVDTALERVAERLKSEPDFQQGLIIRQGPVIKEELRQRFGDQVILERIVARLAGPLKQEKEKLEEETARVEAEERSLIVALTELERLVHERSTLAAHKVKRDSVRSTFEARQHAAKEYKSFAAVFRDDLERALAMGAFRRFLSGLNPKKLEQDAVAAERAASIAEEEARGHRAELLKLEAEIASLHNQLERLSGEMRGYPPESKVRSRLDNLRARLGQIRDRITAIDRQLVELEQRVLAQCRILATTVYRTYLGKSPLRQFDTVVIDEASMLMPPLVYYAAGLSRESVTVAGIFASCHPS
jgi:superfamily I DNA and/or RNA helicase